MAGSLTVNITNRIFRIFDDGSPMLFDNGELMYFDLPLGHVKAEVVNKEIIIK